MVLGKPSERETVALQPNSAKAREVSRQRRGWPSGLEESQPMEPEKPVKVRICSRRSRMLISCPEPRLTGSGLEYFLCKAVVSVGFFGKAIPEIRFAEGDGSEFRVRTNGADADKFFEAGNAAGFNGVQAHGSVVIEEAAGIGAIGADTAHHGGQVYENVGPGIPIETFRL